LSGAPIFISLAGEGFAGAAGLIEMLSEVSMWCVVRKFRGGLFGCALILAVFSGCTSYIPVEKAQPEKFLHISGHFFPGINLTILATYVTTNKACDHQENWLENHGVYTGRTYSVTIQVQQTIDHYEVNMPLDRFESGYCGWAPHSLRVQLSGKDWNFSMGPLVNFVVSGNSAAHLIGDGTDVLPDLEIKCAYVTSGKNSFLCAQSRGKNFNQNAFFIPNEPENLQINFIQKEANSPIQVPPSH
jgi:hypothetical protein